MFSVKKRKISIFLRVFTNCMRTDMSQDEDSTRNKEKKCLNKEIGIIKNYNIDDID